MRDEGPESRRVVRQELNEWWEDIRAGSSSSVVVVSSPPGWGREEVFESFIADAEAMQDAASVPGNDSIVIALDGRSAGDSLGMQTAWLTARVDPATRRQVRIETLSAGEQRLALAISTLLVPLGLLVSGPFAGLVAGLAPNVLGAAVAELGQRGASRHHRLLDGIGRIGRIVSNVSIDLPILIVADSAEHFEEALVLRFLQGLFAYSGCRVLVVVGCEEASGVAAEVQRLDEGASRSGRRVFDCGVPDARTVQERADYVRAVIPNLRDEHVLLVARRTRGRADIDQVAADPVWSNKSVVDIDSSVILNAVDRNLSRESTLVADAIGWLGGRVLTSQFDAICARLGFEDPLGVTRVGSVVTASTGGPISERFEERTRPGERFELYRSIRQATPRQGTTTPYFAVVGHRALARAAAGVGNDAASTAAWIDVAEAYLALEDVEPVWDILERLDRRKLSSAQQLRTAVVRSASTALSGSNRPASGVLSLEGELWEQYASLSTGASTASDLDSLVGLAGRLRDSTLSNRANWMVLLATLSCAYAKPHVTEHLLAPILAGEIGEGLRHAANSAMEAVSGPRSEQRLIILEGEHRLDELELDEQRIGALDQLAAAYDRLGDARNALRHGKELLSMRERHLDHDHRVLLITRGRVARWTRAAGDPQAALRLIEEMLPDFERVLGPDDENTLAARSDIAGLVGVLGGAPKALRLSTALLTDRLRVLGPDHPHTMVSRSSIAHWTARVGDKSEALHLFTELLPDVLRVFDVDHYEVLSVRTHIAGLTGELGSPSEALRLFEELLPDVGRVMGVEHPAALSLRSNIAALTGELGDAQAALRLCQELLDDEMRLRGREHPLTLGTRANVAHWTAKLGDQSEALRLCEELLPELLRVATAHESLALTASFEVANNVVSNALRTVMRIRRGL